MTVDEYIAAQPENVRPALRRLREIVRSAVPQADESIAYGMPTYKLQGKVVTHFAVWRDHYALYAMNERVQETFKDELARYNVNRGTVRFSLREPLPEQLIERLVHFRASLDP